MSKIKLVLAATLIFTGCSKKIQYIPLPMPYSSFAAAFESFRKHSEYVPMTDGTEIAMVIFIPIQGEGNDQFPVIFLYTPYRRANIDHETGKIEDLSSDSDVRFLLSQYRCFYRPAYGLHAGNLAGRKRTGRLDLRPILVKW